MNVHKIIVYASFSNKTLFELFPSEHNLRKDLFFFHSFEKKKSIKLKEFSNTFLHHWVKMLFNLIWPFGISLHYNIFPYTKITLFLYPIEKQPIQFCLILDKNNYSYCLIFQGYWNIYYWNIFIIFCGMCIWVYKETSFVPPKKIEKFLQKN